MARVGIMMHGGDSGHCYVWGSFESGRWCREGLVESDRVVRRNERAVFRELAEGEGSVLLHLDSGAYHGLNQIGTLIWTLIGDGSRLDELVDAVGSRLTDPPAELRSDVSTFVEDLVQRDLLTLSEI